MGQVTTVTIAGVTYSIYGERDANGATAQPSAGEYLNASMRWNAVWAALSPDNQARALVSATRWIDAQAWRGTRTSEAQPLQWPRTGVTRADGTAVDSATVPDEVVFACYELAAAVSQDPGLFAQAAAGTAGNVKKVEGGPAKVEFFRPTSIDVFPADVMAFLGQFMASTELGSFGLGVVTGANDVSSFDEDEDYYSVGGPL